MHFAHPAFHSGVNTTFRLGKKWQGAEVGTTIELFDMDDNFLGSGEVISIEKFKISDVPLEALQKSGCYLAEYTNQCLLETLRSMYTGLLTYLDEVICITFFKEADEPQVNKDKVPS